MKSKLLMVGLMALMMATVFVLSCKKDEPCCTAETFKGFVSDDFSDILSTLTSLPDCCREVIIAISYKIAINPDYEPTDADLGCCAGAVKDAGGLE